MGKKQDLNRINNRILEKQRLYKSFKKDYENAINEEIKSKYSRILLNLLNQIDKLEEERREIMSRIENSKNKTTDNPNRTDKNEITEDEVKKIIKTMWNINGFREQDYFTEDYILSEIIHVTGRDSSFAEKVFEKMMGLGLKYCKTFKYPDNDAKNVQNVRDSIKNNLHVKYNLYRFVLMRGYHTKGNIIEVIDKSVEKNWDEIRKVRNCILSDISMLSDDLKSEFEAVTKKGLRNQQILEEIRNYQENIIKMFKISASLLKYGNYLTSDQLSDAMEKWEELKSELTDKEHNPDFKQSIPTKKS